MKRLLEIRFAIFWGLLLDGIFLFWVTFVFFFPQSLSRLPLLEFISTCSVVDFAFRFEISALNTFNLLAITMLWQHALNDLYRTQDLLRHISQFTRVSYSTGTGFRNKVKIYVWCDYSRRWLVIAAVCGTTACIYRNFKTVEPFFICHFDTCLFEKHFAHQGLFRKARVSCKFSENGQKRAKYSKIWPKLNKIWKYFGKAHVTACNYCT